MHLKPQMNTDERRSPAHSQLVTNNSQLSSPVPPPRPCPFRIPLRASMPPCLRASLPNSQLATLLPPHPDLPRPRGGCRPSCTVLPQARRFRTRVRRLRSLVRSFRTRVRSFHSLVGIFRTRVRSLHSLVRKLRTWEWNVRITGETVSSQRAVGFYWAAC